jgi:hypothetical protein
MKPKPTHQWGVSGSGESIQLFSDIEVSTTGLAAPRPVIHTDEATGRRTCALGITPAHFVTPPVRLVESLATLPTTTLTASVADPSFSKWIGGLEERVATHVADPIAANMFKSKMARDETRDQRGSLRCMVVDAPAVFDCSLALLSDAALWPVGGDEVQLVLAPTITTGQSGWGIVFVVKQVLGPL